LPLLVLLLAPSGPVAASNVLPNDASTVAGSAPHNAAGFDVAWLSVAPVPRDRLTLALEDINGVPPQKAKELGRMLTERAAQSGGESRWASALLAAAAFERGGDTASQRTALQDLISGAAETPYAASAEYRLRLLRALPPENKRQEDIHQAMADKEPDTEGWFEVYDHWRWTSRQAAAWKTLARLRGGDLAYRVFAFVHARSPLPLPYAYLFVLLAVTLAGKLLALPLIIRTARLAPKVAALQRELADIEETYGYDPVRKKHEIAAAYARQGPEAFVGCLAVLIDLAFLVGMLVTFSDFRPQLALDRARFIWVDDVNRFSLSLTLAVILANFLVSLPGMVKGGQKMLPGQALFGALIVSVGVLAAAWYWRWPAYLLVYFMILTIVGLLLQRLVALTVRPPKA
jgi:membrane protein insertase Oxa1/YidC/SpoIIIJ